jgi:hypothetical protein
MSQDYRDSQETFAGQKLSGTEFLAAIVESSGDAIVGKTLDGVIASWNRGAEQMYGYAAVEAIGQPISLIIPQHRIEEFAEILERVRRGDRVERYETERLTKSGRLLRVSLAVSPVRDRSGVVIGASAVARDITDLKQAEAALAESERRYYSLVQSAMLGIYRAALDGRFLEVNPALVRMLGYDDGDELLRLSMASHIFVHAAAHEELVAACMQGQGVQLDVRWKRKDGKQITVHLSVHVVISAMQATIEAIAEDVTLQRQLDRKLHQLERFELLGQLAGAVVHDLNNYLNVIVGHEFLVSSATGAIEDVRYNLQGIRTAAEHAAELTKRMLLLGKRESGPAREHADPNVVVQDVHSMLKAVLPPGILLSLDLSSYPLRVRAGAGDVQQIMVNLALNARDAMPDGGQVRITIRHKVFAGRVKTITGDYLSGSYMALTVADTGHGMDKATALRAIEPFFSTKPEGKGTGLGLSSVYATLKQYGGTLDIATAVGRGTRITIYLPLAPGPQNETSTLESSRALPGTVLVVDDDDGVRPIIAEILSVGGFRVIQHSTWKDALAALERETVDLILCDLHLPDVSRSELLEGLRWWQAKTRVVVISGGQLTEDEERALRPGVFLRKPFSTAQLLSLARGRCQTA